MQPIPKPHILDPDRILDNDRGDFTADHKARADLLDDALHETCAYAQQLWDQLDAVRAYLTDSLPADPRSPGPHAALSASPTGPDDDDGWARWIEAYAAVTSVLCGSHGDSGFGAAEARTEARFRREAPNVKVVARLDQAEATDTGTSDEPPPAPPTPEPDSSKRLLRTAGLAALIALALRGLSPKRAPSPRA